MRGSSREDKVEEFHDVFGLAVDAEWTGDLLSLRESLLQEEWDELKFELHTITQKIDWGVEITKADKAALLKEMADLQYVLSGLAVALNLPLNIAFNRVHQSNMSKLGEDGKPIYREDGKVLKGPNYTPVNLESLV